MTAGQIIGRGLASAAVVAAALAFVMRYGPGAGSLRADVYAPLIRAAGFLPPPGGGGPALMAGRAQVNGQTFLYAVGHSALKLDDVLDHFEGQFAQHDPAGGAPVITAARLRRDGAGIVSGVQFGAWSAPDDVGGRLQAFAATGRLSELGEFHIVSAFDESEGTSFIDFTPGPDVRWQDLLPSGTADAAGADVPGVARPAGLQRLLTIENGEGATWSRTLVYRVIDNAAGREPDVVAAFRAAGWQANPRVDAPGVAHLTNGRGEVFVAGAEDGVADVVVVVYRLVSGRRSES